MDIQSVKQLIEINAIQSISSAQNNQSSTRSSMFTQLLNEALQNSDISSGRQELPLFYTGSSPVFIPSSLAIEPESVVNTFSSHAFTSKSSTNYKEIIQQAAAKYNLPEKLISSVIEQESNFDASAVSMAGASGLMQLMPGTAKYLGVNNILDPYENIMGGAKYLRLMLNQFDGNTETALAAYNAGPGTVKKYGGIPPYKETQNYVQKVMDNYKG